MRRFAILGILVMGSMACGKGASPETKGPEPWAVTAWGSVYEVFAEIEPLTAGKVGRSNTHVTWLEDFSPLREGSVSLLLSEEGRPPLVFEQKKPLRDGIFAIDVQAPREGTYTMTFRIEGPRGREEIPAGQVRIGGPNATGELLAGGAASGPEAQAVSFLKEQQWRTEFATAWAKEGALRESIAGPARVRAAAGGEVVLTAPVDAVVAPQPWPYVGEELQRGATVFGLIPSGSSERSLSELQAQATALEAEEKAARGRVERLDGLLRVEAVSAAEVERARANLVGLQAKLEAAREDLRAASAARRGGEGAPSLFLRAPWRGRVAEISTSPGQAVTSGSPLGRVVRQWPVWVEIALRPEDAARLSGEKASGLLLRRSQGGKPVAVPGAEVRLISLAPEIDPQTSSIDALLEVDRSVAELPVGTAAEAELLLEGERAGVIVPVSALVDDGGVTVVYQQLEGESFARHEVRVQQRQGDEAAVEGLRAGARIVTLGAAAIRRASLLSSGVPERHAH